MVDGAKKKAILERAEKDRVKFLRLQFTDILGVIKNVEVPDRQFGDALDGQVLFDGSSIEGFVRIEESDMYLKPDLRTFRVLPWPDASGAHVGAIICDIANPDGTPFAGCPSTKSVVPLGKPCVIACSEKASSDSFGRSENKPLNGHLTPKRVSSFLKFPSNPV